MACDSEDRSSFPYASRNSVSTYYIVAINQEEVMEIYTPVIVALIGVFQVSLAIYFGKRMNAATADKEEANATQFIGTSYSTLVATLEIRLAKLEKSYDDLCNEYETDKAAWAIERAELHNQIHLLRTG